MKKPNLKPGDRVYVLGEECDATVIEVNVFGKYYEIIVRLDSDGVEVQVNPGQIETL